MKSTGSGWSFGPAKINDEKFIAPDFDPNETLDLGLIDEANEEENKAQEAEGQNWWRK